MTDKRYNKYKESSPEATVARIQGIMVNLGIQPEEKWLRTVEGAVSLRLEFAGTGCGVNGKGTDEAFARASAYGEAMERLQSGFLPKATMVEAAVQGYLGFTKAPDEKRLTLDEVLDSGCALLEELTDNFFAPDPDDFWPKTRPAGKAATREALASWMWHLHGPEATSTSCLPYYSLKKGQVEMVPAWEADYYQGSNGQCAGNTPVEALVQGMSELCERYALVKVARERLVLPEIPRDYFARQFPRIAALQEELEALGPFQVKVLDASLGIGLPVISVLFVHRGVHAYRITFGGHPSLAVAAERCLTELLQGFSPLSEQNVAWGCLPLDKDDSFDFGGFYNLENTQINGSGYKHVDFFAPRGAWDEAAWVSWPLTGNQAMLQALTGKLLQLGRDLLIRDNSYLGFPAYTILVPGVGGIGCSRRQQEIAAAVSWWSHRGRNGAPLTPEECRRLLLVLKHNSRSVDRRPVLPGVPDLAVGAAVCRKLGRTKGMVSFTRALAQVAAPEEKDYYQCLDKWAWLTSIGRDPWPYLELFFGAELPAQIRTQWADTCPLERLRQQGAPGDESMREKCGQLRRRLKEAQQANPIDQAALGLILA